MSIQAILFDVNGSLIDILTDEGSIDVFRKMRNFLLYQGIIIHKSQLRDCYFQLLKQQQQSSKEKYPEFDGVAIWAKIIEMHGSPTTKALTPEMQQTLPTLACQMYRSLTLQKKLCLYPGVKSTLDTLKQSFRLAIVTDAQTAYARHELRTVDIYDYFDPIVISGDYGFRKPDKRLFQIALDKLNVKAEDAIYVGNDMYRDVYGAKKAGIKSILYASNQGDKEPHGTEPDYIIYNFAQLIHGVEFLQKQVTI